MRNIHTDYLRIEFKIYFLLDLVLNLYIFFLFEVIASGHSLIKRNANVVGVFGILWQEGVGVGMVCYTFYRFYFAFYISNILPVMFNTLNLDSKSQEEEEGTMNSLINDHGGIIDQGGKKSRI